MNNDRCSLRLPDAYRYRVSWDNIADVISNEYADNPFVGVRLFDATIIEVDPADQSAAFHQHLANNRAVMSLDLFIQPRNFGIDAPILGAALTRYATNPFARAEPKRQRTPAVRLIAKKRNVST